MGITLPVASFVILPPSVLVEGHGVALVHDLPDRDDRPVDLRLLGGNLELASDSHATGRPHAEGRRSFAGKAVARGRHKRDAGSSADLTRHPSGADADGRTGVDEELVRLWLRAVRVVHHE